MSSLVRLGRVLDRASRSGAIRRHLPIYVTEFGVQGFPDRLAGVNPLKAAELRSISELIAWRNPHVRVFSQFLMRDDADLGGFQTGLRFANGRRKPGYEGFRLPLIAERESHGIVLSGLVRPASGRTELEIQRRRPGIGWQREAVVRTSQAGRWRLRVRSSRDVRWRVIWTALDGAVRVGPATRVYRLP